MAVATSRTLVVLQALAEEQQPLSLAQLSLRTGIGRTSLSRLLALLVEERAVALDWDTGRYTVGFWAWQVGAGAITRHGVRAVAYPHIVELATALRSTVNLVLRDGTEAIYIESIEPKGGGLGSRLMMVRHPLLQTASGRVIAAMLPKHEQEALFAKPPVALTPHAKSIDALREELSRIAEDGYATIDREHRADLAGVAVAIRNHSGSPVASLGLPITGSLDARFVERVIPHALATAAAISADLGFRSVDRLQLA